MFRTTQKCAAVKELLKLGARFNVLGAHTGPFFNTRETLVTVAVKTENVAITRLLLDKGATYNEADLEGPVGRQISIASATGLVFDIVSIIRKYEE